ncbi:MAG: hypothetical protein HC872_06905 [Gammaproteobacteria bacterium]|nr:hypothetical protein [Gammaproteobacteria bacterium]
MQRFSSVFSFQPGRARHLSWSRLLALALIVAMTAVLAACAKATPESQPDPAAAQVAALAERVEELSARVDELTPETAVLMAQVQIQHAKLYYAGRTQNWELAGYTLHEINEALQAVQTFNDQFEDFPTPLSELVPSLVGPPLGEIHSAIRARDAARFKTAFDSLTAACNACHATLDHGFIQVQTPTDQEFSNQKF